MPDRMRKGEGVRSAERRKGSRTDNLFDVLCGKRRRECEVTNELRKERSEWERKRATTSNLSGRVRGGPHDDTGLEGTKRSKEGYYGKAGGSWREGISRDVVTKRKRERLAGKGEAVLKENA